MRSFQFFSQIFSVDAFFRAAYLIRRTPVKKYITAARFTQAKKSR
jgi:hypothetical protein